MLSTPTIRELPSPRPDLFAFTVTGTVTRDDMAAMGARMVEAFDAAPGKVDMLLIFEGYEGAETLAGLSWPAVRSRTEALWAVDRYAVAGAPETAASLIDAMDKVMPVRAETYDTADAAWDALARRAAAD